LIRGDQRIDAELRRFLAKTYDLKAVADCEAGPSTIVPMDVPPTPMTRHPMP
jgi:hypothetical protein